MGVLLLKQRLLRVASGMWICELWGSLGGSPKPIQSES